MATEPTDKNPQSERGPQKRYSLVTAVCLIMGICIGSGIFFKSDNVLVATGGSIGQGVVMFCVAALYIVFGGLCLTLFAARTDGAGGLVDYADRFVSPAFARLIGWNYTFVYLPSISAIIFWVAGIYACMVFGLEGTFAQQMGLGLVAFLAVSGLNAVAPRLSGHLQSVGTVVKVAPLVAVGVLGAVSIAAGHATTTLAAAPHAEASGFGWLLAAAPVAFSFDGWPAATSIAPELRDARRNLPIALVAAPLAILALYLAYFVGISVTLGPETVMAAGDASLSLLFSRLFGGGMAAVPNLIALLAVLGTGNGLMLALMRLPLALGLRGDVPHPRWLTYRSPRLGIPVNSALTAVASVLVWMAAHWVVQSSQLIPNGDLSEVSVSLTMLWMLPFFAGAWRMRRRGEADALRGAVAPLLASAGCLFVGLSGLADPARLPFVALETGIVAALWLAMRRRGQRRPDGPQGNVAPLPGGSRQAPVGK